MARTSAGAFHIVINAMRTGLEWFDQKFSHRRAAAGTFFFRIIQRPAESAFTTSSLVDAFLYPRISDQYDCCHCKREQEFQRPIAHRLSLITHALEP
ncbi:MAG TPA: hypothetical protein VID27_04300, partial [Blastocatellia bacterium]